MASRGTHKLQVKYVDQVGIIIRDLNKVMETWSKRFGIRPWITHERDILNDEIYPRKLKLAFANIGQLQVELLEPIRDKLKQGKSQCSDGGRTELQIIGPNLVAYQWFDANGEFRAEGYLKRKDQIMVMLTF